MNWPKSVCSRGVSECLGEISATPVVGYWYGYKTETGMVYTRIDVGWQWNADGSITKVPFVARMRLWKNLLKYLWASGRLWSLLVSIVYGNLRRLFDTESKK